MDAAFSLEGKKILVTGAGSGIGRECAIRLAASGAEVFLNGRNSARLEEVSKLCSNSRIVVADLINAEDRKRLVDSIDKLDGIAMCAGVGGYSLLKFAKDDDIDPIMDTNVGATIKLVRDIVQKKILNKGASLVCVASVAGMISRPGQFAYGTSKAALINFCRDIAVDLAPRGIRVNSVSPGFVKTPMNLEFMKNEPLLCAADEKKYLLGHGEPADVANAIHFLLSAAAAWITGTNLVIDGGYVCHK